VFVSVRVFAPDKIAARCHFARIAFIFVAVSRQLVVERVAEVEVRGAESAGLAQRKPERARSRTHSQYETRATQQTDRTVSMKSSVTLTVTSLISILLLSLHISEDIVLGFAGGGLENLFAIAILVVYLCGTLLLGDRRSGLIIILVGSIIAAAMPVLHMMGAGVGVRRSAGAFFFVWTLYALGISGTFGVILSALALRRSRSIQR
jgi:membrane-bound ClpP family serine protease